MRTTRLVPRPLLAALVLLAATLLVVGCYNPFRPPELSGGISTPPPTPDTPSGTLRLLEWCYNNRTIAEYRELFTDDYRFVFGALDPYGNAYRENPWTREDELVSTTRLFQGGGDKQAASSITLSFDRTFAPRGDPRPGKQDDPRYRTIRTTVQLSILDADQLRTDVTGHALFFLVRGDTALIPQELKDRGFGPDPARWYIERWEDQSAITPGGSLAPSPVTPFHLQPPAARPALLVEQKTWGYVKVAWR